MRIGLVGASAIAPNAVIGPSAARSDVAVTAVAASDPGRARHYAQRHGIAATSASYADLVERDDVDLVYCALPPALHVRWCEAALAAGKMVLVEKPYALDAAEARRIVEAENRSGRPVIEAFHYRYHSLFERASELVASGAIGDILDASATFDTPIPYRDGELRWDAACGGGALMDLGCYGIHALRSLLGQEPVVVAASADFRNGVDASLCARLMFGKVPATTGCSMTAGPVQELRLEGSGGRLILTGFVAPHEGGRLVIERPDGRHVEQASGPTTYEAQLDHVVRVFRGEERPRTGGQDAIANMAAIEACLSAARMPSSGS